MVGGLIAEANGLSAFVVSILRAGTARQICRSIDGRMIDAISLLCEREESNMAKGDVREEARVVVVHAHAHASVNDMT